MNNIKYIDENWFSLRTPNNNENILTNLSTQKKETYLKLYSIYSYLLNQYLIKKLNLKEYDTILANWKINFPVIQENNMDIYQYLSSGLLKYFYLRNNIYIERLSKEDTDYLYNIYNTKNLNLDEEKEKFIERTYLNIILEEPNQINHYINYGPDNSNYFKPTNAIIIGFRFDEYLNHNIKTWPETHYEQLEIVNNLLEIVKYDINKLNLSIPVCIIKYNDFSIKKTVDNKKNKTT